MISVSNFCCKDRMRKCRSWTLMMDYRCNAKFSVCTSANYTTCDGSCDSGCPNGQACCDVGDTCNCTASGHNQTGPCKKLS